MITGRPWTVIAHVLRDYGYGEEVIASLLIGARDQVLQQAVTAIEDPDKRQGLGWESARDVVQKMIHEHGEG